MQTNDTRGLKFLVLALFALLALFHLANVWSGHSLFRASHLGTAIEYSRGSIDLLRPTIVGFNANGTPTPLEFPLWQAAVGLVFKITGSTWYGWANFVSLFFFATSLWPFFQLARQYVGERTAWWALAFFLAQPVIVLASGQGATDGFCLVLTIWFLFFADRMIRTGKFIWWLPTALFASLSAVEKPPFLMAAGFCSAFLIALNGIRNWRAWAMLVGAGFVSIAAFVLWTNYSYAVLAQAEYPFAEMRLSHSAAAMQWFFGDMHFRLNPAAWLKGGWRFLHATLGSLAFIVLLIPALLRRGNWFSKFWLLATFLTAVVFTSAVLIHWHYYLMCCPAVALLCAATIADLEKFWTQQMPRAWLTISLAGLALVFSAIDGTIATKISIFYDPFPCQTAEIIREHTKPEDKLIIYCAGARPWPGEELFGSDRKGFFVSEFDKTPGTGQTKSLVELLTSESDLRRLKELGYNKLVLISESPAQFAVQAVNPGSTRQRIFYAHHIGPNVDAWQVVYESEDILIKEIL